MKVLVPLVALSQLFVATQSHRMSRHLVTDDLSMVILIAEPGAQATPGPFDGTDDDYITSSNMLSAGLEGSPGVPVNRSSVLDGVPLDLTLKVYAIDEANQTMGFGYEGVEVLLWHTDAAGVYSAVAQDGTEGQKWLRGRQLTDQDGIVTFQTILAGPYRGRALHYHIRLRLPGETAFVATSQFVISDADWEKFNTEDAYIESNNAFSSLSQDGIFNSMGDVFQDLLTLDFSGDFATGVKAELDFGLLTSDASLLNGSISDNNASMSEGSPEQVATTITPTSGQGVLVWLYSLVAVVVGIVILSRDS